MAEVIAHPWMDLAPRIRRPVLAGKPLNGKLLDEITIETLAGLYGLPCEEIETAVGADEGDISVAYRILLTNRLAAATEVTRSTEGIPLAKRVDIRKGRFAKSCSLGPHLGGIRHHTTNFAGTGLPKPMSIGPREGNFGGSARRLSKLHAASPSPSAMTTLHSFPDLP
jgi:hypothetical protein